MTAHTSSVIAAISRTRNTNEFIISFIGAGTGGALSSCSPNKIIGGESGTSCSPNSFYNLHCKVTFNAKILENSPASARPHRTLLIPFLNNTYRIKLYFKFDCLDCFSPIFASEEEKSSNLCSPSRKKVPAPMISFIISLWCHCKGIWETTRHNRHNLYFCPCQLVTDL